MVVIGNLQMSKKKSHFEPQPLIRIIYTPETRKIASYVVFE